MKKWKHTSTTQKRQLISTGFLNNSWYLWQDALRAGKQGSRPRQLWTSRRPHASVYHLHCKEAQWLLDEITLSKFRFALSIFFNWEISCQLYKSFHWLSREDQHSQRQEKEVKSNAYVLWQSTVVKSGKNLPKHYFYLSVFWVAEEIKTNSNKSGTEWNMHLRQFSHASQQLY